MKKGSSSKDCSPQPLVYSAYLQQKYDKSPERDDQGLQARCQYLTKQLEIKEALITELREYSSQKQHSRSPYRRDEELLILQQKLKSKDRTLHKAMLDNSQLYDENLRLKQKILDLEKNSFNNVQVTKFAHSVTHLVKQCNPAYYQHEPTLRQCWDWLKLILEDYMKIKKSR